VNLIPQCMLFRWYNKYSSFSSSRDHTSEPAGGPLIAWSSTLFSNPTHEAHCSQRKWQVAIPSSLHHFVHRSDHQPEAGTVSWWPPHNIDLGGSRPPLKHIIDEWGWAEAGPGYPQVLHTRYWDVYKISRFHVRSE
jgi:hypothetical protein